MDALERDEVGPLVVEGIGGFAEEFLPLLAHVKEPIVLTNHHPDGSLQLAEDLFAEFKFAGLPELCQVTTEEDEVGLRVKSVDVLDSLQGGFDKAMGHSLVKHVGVGNIGEAEAYLRLGFVLGSLQKLHQLEGVRRNRTAGHRQGRRLTRQFQKRPAVGIQE